MIITQKFNVMSDRRRLYAVGPSDLVKRAVEDTFHQLRWNAKWDKQRVLTFYPGGWADRGLSAYNQGCNLNPMSYYGADSIRIALHYTNNPVVSLIATSVYLKFWWFSKKKQEARFNSFYEAFYYEFRKLELPLIAESDWEALVARHPPLHCSPVWKDDWAPVPAT